MNATTRVAQRSLVNEMTMARTGILETDPTDATAGAVLRAAVPNHRLGAALLTTGLAACGVWLVWRVTHLELHPVVVAFFAAELVGLAAALAVGVALIRASEPRDTFDVRERDCHRFAYCVADIVGRTRSADLHRDVRTAIRAAPRWRPRDPADAAVAAVLAEGPRRLVLVLAVGVGLLVGVAPFPVPPWWAIAGAAVGYVAIGSAHVVLGRRRLHFGDRQRWSYGAIGEIISRDDVVGHAPRSWIGAVGVTVALSISVALRGMSDRWTHGLPAMGYDQRVVGFVVAVALMLGALHTIRTTPQPHQVDSHLVSRRLDEGAARQSLLFATVCVGVIGLLAGTLPGAEAAHGGSSVPAVDAPSHDSIDAEGSHG